MQWRPHANNDVKVMMLWFAHHEANVIFEADDTLKIPTLEGTMTAQPGDWIIRGTRGEFYPVKPEPFADTFEKVRGPLSCSR